MIFGIDQSITGTAVAALSNDGQYVKSILIDSGPTREKDGKSRRIARLQYITDQIVAFIKETCGSETFSVAREDYSYQSKGQVFELGELGGVIDVTLYREFRDDDRFHGYYVLPIGTWKKFCFGRGDFKKDAYYLLKVFKLFGIEFEDDNMADAFMIGRTLWAMFCSRKKEAFFDKMTQDAKVGLLQKASGLTVAKIKKTTFEDYVEAMDAVFVRCVVFDTDLRQKWNERTRGKITAHPKPAEENA